jgi:hypothetical protein
LVESSETENRFQQADYHTTLFLHVLTVQ